MPAPIPLRTEPDSAARRAVLHLLMGAVMISFSGVWVKLTHIPPMTSAFYRVFFGGLILLIPALYRKEIRFYGFRHLAIGLVCGFVFALDLGFYHHSIHYIGPGLSTILANFQVFILTGFGIIFLKERVSLLFALSIPLAFCGLFMIVGIGGPPLKDLYRTGIYYGLAAAACYAGFILLLRKLQSDQNQSDRNQSDRNQSDQNQGGFSFFYVIMMVSFTTSLFLGAEIGASGLSFAIPDLQTLISLLILALFSQGIGWILITNALPAIRASHSGLILLLQPALAFVWDVLFFQRPTGWLNWMGVMVALAAIYMGMMGRNKS